MRISEEVVTDRSQTGPKSGPGANPDSSLGFMLPGTPVFNSCHGSIYLYLPLVSFIFGGGSSLRLFSF